MEEEAWWRGGGVVPPQTVRGLGEERPAVHLVRADVRLLRRKPAAGHQLPEGLRGRSRRVKNVTDR